MKVDASTFVCQTREQKMAIEDAKEQKGVTKADNRANIIGQENDEYSEFEALDGVGCVISDAIRSQLNEKLQKRPTERAIAIRTQIRREFGDEQSK